MLESLLCVIWAAENSKVWAVLESTFKRRSVLSVTVGSQGKMFDQVVGLKKRYRDGEQILGISMPAETPKDRFDEILSADTYDYAVKSLEGTGVAVCHRTYLPELRQQYWDRGVQVNLESPKV